MPASSMDMDFDVIEAALKGQLRELKQLLDAGGDPNAELYFGYRYYTYSAMSEAVGAKRHKAMDLLLAHGANPNGEFDYDASLAHGLALNNDAEGLRVLLNYEPELDTPGSVWMRSERIARYETLTPRDTAERLGHGEIIALIDRHQAIPRIGDVKEVTRDRLFARNANGDCLLDRPDTWHRIGEVLESLAAKGETLTKQDLLETGGDGKSFLHKAVACNALEPLLELLHKQGEGIHASELLNAQGEAAELLDAIAGKFALPLLFAEENWKGRSGVELSAVYRALDAEQKQDVPNIFTLRMQLEGGQGMGRRMAGGIG